jgi:excisionase family DNA binding protein
MTKEYLTTFEAAKILSVTPDAVLKWIKSGILEARRTPGGHHRIAKKNIYTLLEKSQKTDPSIEKQRTFPYCWEYNEHHKNCPNDCEDCLVYKISAKGCYKIFHFPDDYGHLKLNCETSCEECNYYKYIHSAN